MSGVKRKIEDNDPDYEDILLARNSKRNKVEEHNGKAGLNSPVLQAWMCETPVSSMGFPGWWIYFISAFFFSSPRSYSEED